MNLFHSARLKLTAFYFAVLFVFCLLLTFGVREFTNYEMRKADAARRSTVHSLVQQYIDYSDQTSSDNPPQQPPGDRLFARAQQRQGDITRDHLNHDFILLNIALLVVGAVLSYWYAGRTLKPIKEAHEQQKRFTSDASHELRTPLTSMKLENEIFLRQKSFGEHDARELIASNLEEVERLEKLATNLLSLNRYEQAAVDIQAVKVDKTVAAAVAGVKASAAFKTTAFKTKLAPATVQVDSESLREVLNILFDNAVKYGPKKGPIEVTGQAKAGHYELQVRDHGPGIAEADLPHIFERMYRGDKARSSKVSGHGIGLSLAQQIAAANGAKLTAGSHQDGGAVFTLELSA